MTFGEAVDREDPQELKTETHEKQIDDKELVRQIEDEGYVAKKQHNKLEGKKNDFKTKINTLDPSPESANIKGKIEAFNKQLESNNPENILQQNKEQLAQAEKKRNEAYAKTIGEVRDRTHQIFPDLELGTLPGSPEQKIEIEGGMSA